MYRSFLLVYLFLHRNRLYRLLLHSSLRVHGYILLLLSWKVCVLPNLQSFEFRILVGLGNYLNQKEFWSLCRKGKYIHENRFCLMLSVGLRCGSAATQLCIRLKRFFRWHGGKNSLLNVYLRSEVTLIRCHICILRLFRLHGYG